VKGCACVCVCIVKLGRSPTSGIKCKAQTVKANAVNSAEFASG
jgi:hypothetical protein